VGKGVFLPTFAAVGGQPKHAAHPTENVKVFMRTYLYGSSPSFFKKLGF